MRRGSLRAPCHRAFTSLMLLGSTLCVGRCRTRRRGGLHEHDRQINAVSSCPSRVPSVETVQTSEPCLWPCLLARFNHQTGHGRSAHTRSRASITGQRDRPEELPRRRTAAVDPQTGKGAARLERGLGTVRGLAQGQDQRHLHPPIRARPRRRTGRQRRHHRNHGRGELLPLLRAREQQPIHDADDRAGQPQLGQPDNADVLPVRRSLFPK